MVQTQLKGQFLPAGHFTRTPAIPSIPLGQVAAAIPQSLSRRWLDFWSQPLRMQEVAIPQRSLRAVQPVCSDRVPERCHVGADLVLRPVPIRVSRKVNPT